MNIKALRRALRRELTEKLRQRGYSDKAINAILSWY